MSIGGMAVMRFSSQLTIRTTQTSAFFQSIRPSTSYVLSTPSHHSFSSSPALDKRPDRNRGVSPLRRTGPAQALSVHKYPLPKPVTDPQRRSKVEVAEDHGLWQFFKDRKNVLSTPTEDAAHGRAWNIPELRRKRWEELHALWWVCMKERSRIQTSNRERKRLRAGFGAAEANERLREVRSTQRRIRQTLIRRWYAWEDAVKLAETDPTIDLSGEGALYDKSRAYDEEIAEQQRAEEEPESLEVPSILPRESGSERTSTNRATV